VVCERAVDALGFLDSGEDPRRGEVAEISSNAFAAVDLTAG